MRGKAIAWRDSNGVVKLAYTDPAWLAKRYGIQDRAMGMSEGVCRPRHVIHVNQTR